MYGILHPSLYPYLQSAGLKVQPYIKGNIPSDLDIVFISSYRLNTENNCNIGIHDLLDLRFSGCSNPVIVLSFFSEQQLSQYDTYGVLQLCGCTLLRLPFTSEQLLGAIKDSEKTEAGKLAIFRKNVYNKLLAQKVSLLKHGDRFDFINRITGPLRSMCVMAKSDHALLLDLRLLLQKVNRYINQPDIVDLIQLIHSSPTPNDNDFFITFKFADKLKALTDFDLRQASEVNILVEHIDDLNETFSIMLQTWSI